MNCSYTYYVTAVSSEPGVGLIILKCNNYILLGNYQKNTVEVLGTLTTALLIHKRHFGYFTETIVQAVWFKSFTQTVWIVSHPKHNSVSNIGVRMAMTT